MLFFRDWEDAELCYPKEHFMEEFQDKNLLEIRLYEAVPDKDKSYFFCRAVGEVCSIDSYSFGCGKNCDDYCPRNGKSGICKHKTFCRQPNREFWLSRNGKLKEKEVTKVPYLDSQ